MSIAHRARPVSQRGEGRTLAAFATAGWFHTGCSGLRGAGGVGAVGRRDAEVVPKVSPASRAEGPAALLGRAGLQRRLSLQLPAAVAPLTDRTL